jgi:hypothetical protein
VHRAGPELMADSACTGSLVAFDSTGENTANRAERVDMLNRLVCIAIWTAARAARMEPLWPEAL